MPAEGSSIEGSRPPANALALSRLAHDRAAHRRTDQAWLDAEWEHARVLVITTAGLVAVVDTELDGGTVETGVLYVRGGDVASGAPPAVSPGPIFLGVDGPAPFFAHVVAADATPPEGARFANLRDVGAAVDELDAGLLTSAVALVAFHTRNGFCPHCGAPSVPDHAGWVRRCTNEGIDLFPRSDPAVIMLVHDGGDRCVLGRQQVWPAGRFSVLAGFVEAGEPFEAAVVREVGEEVGLDVTDVRYVASQPWPFPQSLMIGCTARATTDQIVRRDEEIAEAFWFTRDEVRQAVTWDAAVDFERAGGAELPGFGPDGVLKALPGPVSIARQLLDAWVDGRL
ncbi:NAD(+) diphosphatase [Jatrophihabitans sp. YIM 134969]